MTPYTKLICTTLDDLLYWEPAGEEEQRCRQDGIQDCILALERCSGNLPLSLIAHLARSYEAVESPITQFGAAIESVFRRLGFAAHLEFEKLKRLVPDPDESSMIFNIGRELESTPEHWRNLRKKI
jgi:hypothetical protein